LWTNDEPELVEAFQHELSLPNIEVIGWMDVTSESFARLAAEAVALVYPSCGEGHAGAVVNCVRAGLLPLVSPASGVDVEDFGSLLVDCSVEGVHKTVKEIASLDAQALYARARKAWDYGARRFSAEAYSQRYGEIIDELVTEDRT
jgi:hypothetical protein